MGHRYGLSHTTVSMHPVQCSYNTYPAVLLVGTSCTCCRACVHAEGAPAAHQDPGKHNQQPKAKQAPVSSEGMATNQQGNIMFEFPDATAKSAQGQTGHT